MKHLHFVLAIVLALGSAQFMGCDSNDDDNSNSQQGGENGNAQQGGENGNAQQGGENGGTQEFINPVKSTKPRVDSTIADADLASFVKSQYDLSFDLLRKSGDEIAKKNAMVSVYSIQTAVAMAWAGANGETATEIQQALKFDDHAHEALNKLDKKILSLNMEAYENQYEKMDAVEIKTSNNIYLSPKYTWSPEWLDMLAVNYDAGITEMNFAADPEKARNYINQVVSDDTHERIKDLLPEGSITDHTQAVLTNAVYFKAPWAGVVQELSNPIDFKKLDGSQIKADGLAAWDNPYTKGDGYQAVSIPLREFAFRVLFILPDEGKYDSVITALNGDMVKGIFDSFKGKNAQIIRFPSITFSTSLNLKDPLKAMGMIKAFDSSSADFSKMTVEPNELYISDAFHQTFIGMDDKGVEAAAATALIASDEAMPEETIEMNIDRPYIFVIYENETHTPLFVGHVMDPSAK